MASIDTNESEASKSLDPAAAGEAALDAAEQERPLSLLVFPVAGYGLLLDQQTVMEFLENQTPYHIPNHHSCFRGLINRRGSLVPVFDIRSLVDGVERAGGDDKVLVLGTGDDAVGVVLDGTPYRATIREEHRTQPPGELTGAFGDFLGDCFGRDGDILAFVELVRFLYQLVDDMQEKENQ